MKNNNKKQPSEYKEEKTNNAHDKLNAEFAELENRYSGLCEESKLSSAELRENMDMLYQELIKFEQETHSKKIHLSALELRVSIEIWMANEEEREEYEKSNEEYIDIMENDFFCRNNDYDEIYAEKLVNNHVIYSTDKKLSIEGLSDGVEREEEDTFALIFKVRELRDQLIVLQEGLKENQFSETQELLESISLDITQLEIYEKRLREYRFELHNLFNHFILKNNFFTSIENKALSDEKMYTNAVEYHRNAIRTDSLFPNKACYYKFLEKIVALAYSRFDINNPNLSTDLLKHIETVGEHIVFTINHLKNSEDKLIRVERYLKNNQHPQTLKLLEQIDDDVLALGEQQEKIKIFQNEMAYYSDFVSLNDELSALMRDERYSRILNLYHAQEKYRDTNTTTKVFKDVDSLMASLKVLHSKFSENPCYLYFDRVKTKLEKFISSLVTAKMTFDRIKHKEEQPVNPVNSNSPRGRFFANNPENTSIVASTPAPAPKISKYTLNL